MLRHVKRCKDFLLIVDRHIFDRIFDASYPIEDDWVRKELSEALKMGDDVINIILIILPKAKLPSNLPMDISDVCKWQWIEIKTQYDLQEKFKEIKTDYIASLLKFKVNMYERPYTGLRRVSYMVLKIAKLRIYPMSIEPCAELLNNMKNYYQFGEIYCLNKKV